MEAERLRRPILRFTIYELHSQICCGILPRMGNATMPVRQRAAKPGRPRALTLEDIVEAARRMGLANLKMPALAAELGIGAGTLYNYVSSRAELLRLVVMQRPKTPLVDNGKDDWREIVRTHTRDTFLHLVEEPELLDLFMRGVVGPDIVLGNLESFVACLTRRGFEPREAYIVLSAVNTLCFGAMVRHHYTKLVDDADGSAPKIIRSSLRNLSDGEFPTLRAIFDTAADVHFDFNTLLEVMIEGLAVQLGREHGKSNPALYL